MIKPEIVAVITATLAAYGYPAEMGYRVTGIRKKVNNWKRAGLRENMRTWQSDTGLQLKRRPD